MEYLERACLFRANDLVKSCFKLAFKCPQKISDADLTRLAGKYPELAVDLFKLASEKGMFKDA